MKQFGFLFPGQGAQAVGMGFDFYLKNQAAKKVFTQADEILNFPVTRLCFEGPDTELVRTKNTQIAIFVTSMATLESVKLQFPDLQPQVSCGLSLGEFTALTAIGAISFEDALKLVQIRGELMEQAAESNPGTMASIIGLSLDDIREICNETGAVPANINSPEQVVISGSVDSVKQACELCEANGAKRAIQLKVGGAFHSPLMKSAEEGLKKALQKIRVSKTNIPFIPNVTGEVVNEPETIRMLLANQLTSPVEWVKTMQTCHQMGLREFLEMGPGSVLKGLARKINSELIVYNINKTEHLEKLNTMMLEGTTNAS
ncbi:MAG: [acyl-carrier-protein] S-malonyltransferase [Omnitrophica bacterium RIFCSPLOWO2_12_FULL_44_17]|uniref:Malonyl CoA-acyl carrier protein transacylase n=1 Tax=Candidatus Danuiimicrobium aquiferis TaxID=1801832 RepID=A0A1G1KZ11_9BACT|nr:MAG: [acyl-carrier-protein] S-malonyltransferase [Omnitrophica bacterium RIFCSPHIGHO2_02_FULL_45_28]OGW90246.1 MAG: [acyl-carrier-protein] S-malonyltransferase [Omnitrophica bacterium RIFCSPHIGHO2_12_FULL_44_12]OGW98092.1 MAG: [acyl-carrier-protein] S-malonyltransferase [Omnitrophica bacterium RIFCSPLOWO2_12_FULL_44_17]